MTSQATPKQLSFIKRLIEDRHLTPRDLDRVDQARRYAIEGHFSTLQASDLINWLLSLPTAAAAEVPEGMHYRNGDYLKVVRSQYGRFYAKVLQQDETGRWSFKYAPGAISRLDASTVMPASEAARFGATYGICVNCGRTLTHESSVAHGYGPVCAENNGWPWGDVPTYAEPSEAPAPVEVPAPAPADVERVVAAQEWSGIVQEREAALDRQRVEAKHADQEAERETEDLLGMLDAI